MHSVLQFVWVSNAATFFGFEIHYGASEASDEQIKIKKKKSKE